MRESLPPLFLRAAGYAGSEPVLDPMCGSGTFVIEAAEIAAGLAPGRSRRFAFEQLAGFDPAAWAALRAGTRPRANAVPLPRQRPRRRGHRHEPGERRPRRAWARSTRVPQHPVSALERPEGPAGLVIVNPPYGKRLGEAKELRPLYAALGATLKARFGGWRVALVTSEATLARATGLPFAAPGPVVPHGGLKVRLWQTGPL